MSTNPHRRELRINAQKVKQHMAALSAADVALEIPEPDPSKDMRGGWADPMAEDEKVHYMHVIGKSETPEHYELRSLCGTLAGTGTLEELTDADPLALENCITCRTILLAQRNLIA